MIKKITSLTLAWMFLVSAISGLLLYIAPPGRIAHWADWKFFGLSKNSWDHLHTVTTIMMIGVVVLHLYYNWKPFTSYMKDKLTKLYSATKELTVSLLLVTVIAFGAVWEVPPFGWIVDLGDYVSESWEKQYGSPPYNHAELDSVKTFSKKLKMDYEETKVKLKQNSIAFGPEEPLVDIAANNKVSPQDIYKIITGSREVKTDTSMLQGSGMGRKTLSQVCELYRLDVDTVMMKLETKGIKAKPNDKFKEIAEQNGIHPTELLSLIRN